MRQNRWGKKSEIYFIVWLGKRGGEASEIGWICVWDFGCMVWKRKGDGEAGMVSGVKIACDGVLLRCAEGRIAVGKGRRNEGKVD